MSTNNIVISNNILKTLTDFKHAKLTDWSLRKRVRAYKQFKHN